MNQALGMTALEDLEEVARRLGIAREKILDHLVRELGVDRLGELVAERRARDGAARAAWSRAR